MLHPHIVTRPVAATACGRATSSLEPATTADLPARPICRSLSANTPEPANPPEPNEPPHAKHPPAARRLPAAVPSTGRKPRRLPGPRPGADGMARPARLPRSLDRRAPLRRLGTDQLARAVHRRRLAAHAIDPLRHRRDLAAVPQPA